jgi:tetratricopeptide (TPR) repeat protein
MQGLLGDRLFADLVRELWRDHATGRLTITRDREAIEVFFDCGIPTAASTTVPDEQMECRLVRDGLVGAEQIKTAWLAARESSGTLEGVLVEDGIVPAAAMEQAQRDASLQALNLAFEWHTGDYSFDPVSCPRPGAKLTLTPAECILKGARHASANETILDAIAPDHRIVGPAREGAASIEQSATLSSVEGYVLSCIQSPISIAETGGLTGLPHSETRRAVFVLILLGLLTDRQFASDYGASDQQPSIDQPGGKEPASEKDASEQPGPAVQWCAVDYVSSDGGFPHQYWAASELDDPDKYSVDHEFSGSGNAAAQEYESSIESDARNDREDPAVRTAAGKGDDAQDGIAITPATDSAASPGAASGGDHHNSTPERSDLAPNTPFAESLRRKSIAQMMTSEEAAYQERLFLEEKLDNIAIADCQGEGHVPETPAEGAPGPATKSLTTAIQELNIRLRLARSGPRETPAGSCLAATSVERDRTTRKEVPSEGDLPATADRPLTWAALALDPEHGARPKQSTEADHSAELRQGEEPQRDAEPRPPCDPEPSLEELPIEEQPILQPPVTFDEPLRIGGPLDATPALPPEDLIAKHSLVPLITTGEQSAGNNGEAGISAGAAGVPAINVQPAGASLPHRDGGGDERLLRKIIGRLDARLAAAASADYYQLLGIDRLASNGKITESYQEMVALYGGYKTRWPEDEELQSRITELMSRIERAYETLGDVERRRVYDLPMAKEQPRQATKTEQPDKIAARPLQMTINEPGRPAPRTIVPQTGAPFQQENDTCEPDRKKPSPPIGPSLARKNKRSPAGSDGADVFKPDLRNPFEAAEEYCKRGRALYERMDLHTAAHLFREAIKLDPNRASYHYQLGLVLSTLSQARKEHKHHKGCHVTCRLGGFLARNQRVRREAERHLLKAAELDPSNPEIKLKLGTLYKEAALDQKAHQYFNEALMLDANCELARLELGLDREPALEKPAERIKRKPGRRSRRQ